LPAEDKIRRDRRKAILRDAFKDSIPLEVARRPKQAFQAPVLSWINGSLKGWIAEMLNASTLDVNAMGLQTAKVETRRDAYRRWSVAAFEAWRHELDLTA
jgi:asparagine synthase (glutamine-hydrolysing)